jgi:hypothetical protein
VAFSGQASSGEGHFHLSFDLLSVDHKAVRVSPERPLRLATEGYLRIIIVQLLTHVFSQKANAAFTTKTRATCLDG